ncbi:MAG: macro domain-containing protein [Candidatus Hydrothermarchaeota archaeon]
MIVKGTEISVLKGDITELDVEAIVNPANSYGTMGGGVALAIKNKGGDEIEMLAMERAPIEVGSAICTPAGKLRAKIIIHAPTMEEPSMPTTYGNVKKALRASLNCALKKNIKTMAIPGMGTGVGGLEKNKVAKLMIEEIVDFLEKNEGAFSKVILVGYDDELFKAFQSNLKL